MDIAYSLSILRKVVLLLLFQRVLEKEDKKMRANFWTKRYCAWEQ